MTGKSCELCQKTEGEFHRCSIEKFKLHCNGCCEKISLGHMGGGKAFPNQGAVM